MNLDFEKGNGLIPVIVQDFFSKKILMLAYQNEFAFWETCKTGLAHYFSRSRKKIWKKGEESGNIQIVEKIFYDCDKDTILLQVEQKNNISCHTGNETCFFREIAFISTNTRKITKKIWKNFLLFKKKDFINKSNTAKILYENNIDFVKKKIKEEKEEILGVINETHKHTTLKDDAVLEMKQFFYWSILEAIILKKDFLHFFDNFFDFHSPVFKLCQKSKLNIDIFLLQELGDTEKKLFFLRNTDKHKYG